jgi:hypothetical protein
MEPELPDKQPSETPPPEAQTIAWGFIAWIVGAVAAVIIAYVFLKK